MVQLISRHKNVQSKVMHFAFHWCKGNANVVRLLVCSHWSTPRSRPRPRPFYNNVRKCFHCSYSETNVNFHWILYTFHRYRSRSRCYEPYLHEMYNWNCEVHLTPSHTDNAYIVISFFCHLQMRYRNVGNPSISDIGNEGTDTSGMSLVVCSHCPTPRPI